MTSRVFRFTNQVEKQIFLAIISDRFDLVISHYMLSTAEFIQIDLHNISIMEIRVEVMRWRPHTVVTEDLVAAMQVVMDKDTLAQLLFK